MVSPITISVILAADFLREQGVKIDMGDGLLQLGSASHIRLSLMENGSTVRQDCMGTVNITEPVDLLPFLRNKYVTLCCLQHVLVREFFIAEIAVFSCSLFD